MNSGYPVIIVGGGGHAKVVLDILLQRHYRIAGIADPQQPLTLPLSEYPWLGDDASVLQYPPDHVVLVNAVGSVRNSHKRQTLYERYHNLGYRFLSLQHNSSVVSPLSVQHGQGLQVLAGAVVNACISLGENIIINTGAVIEHDCYIGDHTHVAPGAVVCGGCRIGRGVHIGAGAVVNQGLLIGDGAVVASGAAVIKDVQSHTLVAGVPAVLKKSLAV